MQFRLHIDIPLGANEEDAIEAAEKIMDDIEHQTDFGSWYSEFGIELMKNIKLQYRLGHDEDRQKSNYLIKTEEGHVTKKKCKIEY